jgi:hypothetical protein
MSERKPTPEQLIAASRKLADDKRVIAGGFEEYRRLVIPAAAPQIQIDETRLGFYAGAQFVLSVLIDMQDDDRQPTADDMRHGHFRGVPGIRCRDPPGSSETEQGIVTAPSPAPASMTEAEAKAELRDWTLPGPVSGAKEPMLFERAELVQRDRTESAQIFAEEPADADERP